MTTQDTSTKPLTERPCGLRSCERLAHYRATNAKRPDVHVLFCVKHLSSGVSWMAADGGVVSVQLASAADKEARRD
jgi:hypothetical protein